MKKPLYLDAKQPIEKRVNDLISRMTIDEKINQMYNKRFRNSLGNLLILSAPKNEKLANRPFPEKCSNKENNIGYQFGSYSEMEVARNSDWTSKTILERGIKLLQFINQKWSLDIKKKDFKKILGFDIPLKK